MKSLEIGKRVRQGGSEGHVAMTDVSKWISLEMMSKRVSPVTQKLRETIAVISKDINGSEKVISEAVLCEAVRNTGATSNKTTLQKGINRSV